jgi:predicted GNAT family acetyltransferase
MASGDAAASVEYKRAGAWIVLTHTEVSEALSGQGLGSEPAGGVIPGS